MHKLILAVFLSAMSVQAMASCDKLKEEIDAKLQAKGVKSYSLEIVPVEAADKGAAAPTASAAAPAAAAPAATAQKASGKVVGTCDGGTKHIVYKRG